jgi:hypothetical protein
VVPDLPLAGGTPFDRLGDWPFWAACLVCIGLAFIVSRRRRRPA